jgi:urease accessory protein
MLSLNNSRQLHIRVPIGIRVWIALPLLLICTQAAAHEEFQGGAGFLSGLFHPVLGFDHLLAMLSVGIVSAQIGGRAIWHIPATFVLAMIVGGILGMQGVQVLLVEAGIAMSVLVLGATLAAEKNLPEWAAMIAVCVFGMFHGHAHGTEMPMIANPWLYGLGFVLGTAIIHLTGVFIGLGFKKMQNGQHLLRAAGLGIAGIGAYILITL